MSNRAPGPTERLRCGGCGNLTRFDVEATRRTTEYWHFDLGGDHRVEDIRTEHEEVGEIRCRWCGRADAIEIVARTDTDQTG